MKPKPIKLICENPACGNVVNITAGTCVNCPNCGKKMGACV